MCYIVFSALFYQEAVSEANLDEMGAEIVRNTLVKWHQINVKYLCTSSDLEHYSRQAWNESLESEKYKCNVLHLSHLADALLQSDVQLVHSSQVSLVGQPHLGHSKYTYTFFLGKSSVKASRMTF